MKLLRNRYAVLNVIGRGGMGAVYRVADRNAESAVLAVKELSADGLDREKREEALAQFQTEARILARLSHPNLPKVTDYFHEGARSYLVMEYVRGRTLERILELHRGKPLDERVVLSWALQICRAMHFLSVQRPRPVVFRDLKPSNIMISRDDRVKLIDFGIARFFKKDKTADTFVYGTPGYAAPEQYGSGQTDARSDIFSLGATLHHCCTGRNPSEHPLDFPDPRTLNPALSKATAALIRKALDPDMGRRFQTAQDMKRAIQKALQERSDAVAGRPLIHASADKPIVLPWWKKTCWVSLPVAALGCGSTTGMLTTDELWIQPQPRSFTPRTAQLIFRVSTHMLKPGREYRPRLIVRTENGLLRPRLVFRKTPSWLLLGIIAAALAAAAAVIGQAW